jgi:hypothetical protein
METFSSVLHDYDICGSRLCLSKRSWLCVCFGMAAPANLFSAAFEFLIFPRARYVDDFRCDVSYESKIDMLGMMSNPWTPQSADVRQTNRHRESAIE